VPHYAALVTTRTENLMSTRRLALGARAAAVIGGLALATTALAQSPAAVSQPPRTQEFGIDAAAAFGLGSDSYTNIGLPASRARVGFFLSNESRWSLEPAVGLFYSDSEGGDGALAYELEFGTLYHFAPTGDLVGRLGRDAEQAVRRSVLYARPFVNLSGVTGGEGDGDSRVSLGAGLGVKVPWRESLAFRYEANLGYDIDNEALRLGVSAGLSFFTRNLIR
jgi:hypothetical protein